MAAKYGSIPFEAQIAFFRDKINLPTDAWTDIWAREHARAFVVAGATTEELLTDLRGAVDKAIADGTTLAEFRKDFDKAVVKHGWSYKGERGWRTRVIYDTNLRTSYAAGRYNQLQAVKKDRPYWRYKHSVAVAVPRQAHLDWDGMVLAAADTWWDTHYPPNGWGCRCRVMSLSESDLKGLGKSGPDTAPAIHRREVTVGANGPSPRTVSVPEGVDPGWDHNVGKAAWGEQLSDNAMSEWQQTAKAWQQLTPGNWETYGRSASLPLESPAAKLGHRLDNQDDMADAVRDVIGGDDATYNVSGLPVHINAKTLGGHIDPARAEYIPLLPDLLNDPHEVWLSFEEHQGTGKVRLRSRIIKAFDIGKGRSVLFVANATRGMLEGWTILPTSDKKYINRQRAGNMLYGKGD